MPPRQFSRHTFTQQAEDMSDPKKVFLTDRTKFLYRDYLDNVIYVVQENDTLHRLASKFYNSLSDAPSFSASWLWWVIADFQPQPIHDPTIRLTQGQQLIIPSLRTVVDRILNPEFRRREGL